MRLSAVPVVAALLVLAACAESPSAPLAPTDAPLARVSGGSLTEHVTDQFFATATCGGDIGSIRFGGTRVMVRRVVGNDTTLSFRVQDFVGWRFIGPVQSLYANEPVLYDVLGGAEMFNIKREGDAPNAPITVKIHNGTLVFVSRLDGSKIVARHIIRDLPGTATPLNTWECRRTG
jgi:hypothetical protein